jgi:signal peptidase I
VVAVAKPAAPAALPSGAQKRRVRKEAAGLAAAARRALKRHGVRVPAAERDAIAGAAAAVEKAVGARDHDATCAGLAQLQDLCDRHLAFAKKSAFREYTDSIGVAVIVALLLRAFVVEAFKIPSGSMIPTMEVGDHIFVNKFLYGLRIPFTKIKFFEYRKPHRGEVIVFIFPVDPDKDFIKRIVAVEGDTVQVRHDVLYVNGQAVEHERVPGDYTYADYDERTDRWSRRTGAREEEKLEGHDYITLHDAHPVEDYGYYRADYPSEPGSCTPTPDVLDKRGDDGGMAPSPSGNGCVVKPGFVFAMGDNRNNSHDSRYWGGVPLENIKGKAMVVWWSSGGPDGIRWDRLGHLVE